MTRARTATSATLRSYTTLRDTTAGIVGNLGHESAGFTAYHEGGQPSNKGGVGWAQWTGVRRRQFEAFSKEHNLDPRSDEASWQFLAHGDPEFRKALEAVKGTHDRRSATIAFEQAFERARIKAYGSRLGFADQAYSMGPADAGALAAHRARADRMKNIAGPSDAKSTAQAVAGQITHNREGDVHHHNWNIQSNDPHGVAREIQAILDYTHHFSAQDVQFT